MQAEFKIAGRIRDEWNRSVEGYTVMAFDKDPRIYMHPDDKLGKSKTDSEGSFQISFSSEVFKDWFEGNPDVYLVVRDGEGRAVLTTSSKENTTKSIDFQVKLGNVKADPAQSDLYSAGLERMTAAFRSAGDFVDPSKTDANMILELLLRTLGSWTLFRDEHLRLSGYDGIQVPKLPRKEDHHHLTRWDEAVLP